MNNNRYIGPVCGSSGEWVGVCWDDASRGLHSGAHKGVAYFETRVAGGGSFVRRSRLSAGKRTKSSDLLFNYVFKLAINLFNRL